MKRLPNSSVYNLRHVPLIFAAIILLACWSLPAGARPPGANNNDNARQKHNIARDTKSPPPRNQQAQHRQMPSPANFSRAHEAIQTAPQVFRAPIENRTHNRALTNMQFNFSPNQSQQTNAILRSEPRQFTAQPRSLKFSNQARWADNFSSSQTPALKRTAPDPPKTIRNNQNTSPGVFAAQTNLLERANTPKIRRDPGTSILMNKDTSPNRSVLAAESAADQNVNIQKNIQKNATPPNAAMNQSSDAGPSIPAIRRRLFDQGRAGVNLPADAAQTFKSIKPKFILSTNNPPQDSSTNSRQAMPLDRVRKHLGAINQDVRTPQDLKKLTNAPAWALQNNPAGPASATKRLSPQNMHLNKGPDVRAPGFEIASNSPFAQRLHSGQLDKLTKGEIAQKLKLSEQYRLMPQGDVARRMDLHKRPPEFANFNIHGHGPGPSFMSSKMGPPPGRHPAHLKNVADFYASRPHYYHDHVGPHYADRCFNFFYFGPSFFAGVCWYPHWDPWVAWSWHYRCRPLWDPRPLWCQPVFYEPSYDWTWWQTPVWAPLPVVPSGTWVEVQQPVVPDTQYDLQLLAVRFVDPGHPEENLGPRYRLWLRNNSDQPISTPFNVMLFAGNDETLTADLPHGGLRVTSIEPGATQSVDIRLPLTAATMARDAQNNPAPYQFVHVLLDANQEIAETNRSNNGAVIARGDVLPVDPAAFQADPTAAPVGGELILAGEGFGPQPGQVLIHIADQELPAEILGWYDLGVRISLPQVELKGPTPAELIVIRGDGAAANPITITLHPAQPGPELVPSPPPLK